MDDLTIDDERSFRHVEIYSELKQSLRGSGYRFHMLPAGSLSARWDRAVFLNLTFWDAEAGDVLVDKHVPADVIAHVAWHHLARKALRVETGDGRDGEAQKGEGRASEGGVSAEALFLGESIASAFDLYLVGRLLGHAPGSDFLESQVPAMAEVAEAAGVGEDAFEELLRTVAEGPEQAFEDLRQLLFDASTTLVKCRGVQEAAAALERFDGHRFGALLHHYELSNWVLFARAYASGASDASDVARAPAKAQAARAIAIDAALRSAPISLDWLRERWIEPAPPG